MWLITISIEWMSFLYGSTSVSVYLGIWLQRVKDYGYQTCFVQTEYQIAWWGWCSVCESSPPVGTSAKNTSRNKVKAWEGQTVGLINTFNWFFFQIVNFFKWSRLFIQHVWLCWCSDIELEGDIWDADLRCYEYVWESKNNSVFVCLRSTEVVTRCISISSGLTCSGILQVSFLSDFIWENSDRWVISEPCFLFSFFSRFYFRGTVKISLRLTWVYSENMQPVTLAYTMSLSWEWNGIGRIRSGNCLKLHFLTLFTQQQKRA